MADSNFDGSSVAGPHIGSSNSDSLSTLLGEEAELTALVAVDGALIILAAEETELTALVAIDAELIILAAEETELTALVAIDGELVSLAAKDTELLAVADDVVNPTVVKVVATPGSDAGNTMPVVIAVTDKDGNAVSGTVKLKCTLYHTTMVPALVGAWHLAESGAGSEVTTTENASLVILTDATGNATLTVTDVATGSTETIQLIVEPLEVPGASVMVALAFTS